MYRDKGNSLTSRQRRVRTPKPPVVGAFFLEIDFATMDWWDADDITALMRGLTLVVAAQASATLKREKREVERQIAEIKAEMKTAKNQTKRQTAETAAETKEEAPR
mgnify:CR=1 FL=1